MDSGQVINEPNWNENRGNEDVLDRPGSEAGTPENRLVPFLQLDSSLGFDSVEHPLVLIFG